MGRADAAMFTVKRTHHMPSPHILSTSGSCASRRRDDIATVG